MDDTNSGDAQPGGQADKLELWGGIECTVVRLHSLFRDQTRETGHSERASDIDAIADLGIRTVRYPIVWETVAPNDPKQTEWRWHDERMAALRQLGIRPIAGLVHHGSGPRYTDLLDPNFPDLLAEYAGRVAERYPWITRFTPINEPLTTARFSALYGHWYPHHRDHRSFLRALLNEAHGVARAFKAIRSVIPNAQLVQTEDLGKTFGASALRDQVAYENDRRWLSLDLLCGRVDPQHPLYSDLIGNGISQRELAALVDEPCPPAVVGINHYLTSERYLDDRYERYPRAFWGGNGRQAYADVEAVRVAELEAHDIGPYPRLKEAWERYRLPMAVTEAHHGCTRDEQVRWLLEVWRAASRLKREGADLRAVTIWSLFGAVDWNSVLVAETGFYEPGAFDVRSNPPRQTALARAAASLARSGDYDHPVLDNDGWWRRDSRFYCPRPPSTSKRSAERRKLLITGGSGTLARAFARICEHRGLDHILLRRAELDIADPNSVETALALHRPWAIINAAGYVRVNLAARERNLCWRDNVRGAGVLASIANKHGLPFVTFSSDLVFDGRSAPPYFESHPVSPRCVYGSSKAAAERLVSAAHPQALIIRTSAFFGPWDRYNFLSQTAARLFSGKSVEASRTTFVSPTYVPDLAHAVLDLLIDETSGVWHLANKGSTSWYDLAGQVAEFMARPVHQLAPSAGEPVDTTLSSERGLILPTLESALERYFNEVRYEWEPMLK